MSAEPIVAPVIETPERRAFYERISRQHLTPLWLSLANLVTPEPVSACTPAAWSFGDIRAAMLEAGRSITSCAPARRRSSTIRTRARARRSNRCGGGRSGTPAMA